MGPFYETKRGSKLAAYSRAFRTVEINSTFYRVPTPGMVLGWGRYSPDDFVFSAKVPQTVTHDRLLKVEEGADRELVDFCDLMRPLCDVGKMGPLLLQLPPRLRFHEERTRAFFERLPGGFQFAIEFRNESWMRDEALDLLKEYDVAYTVVDEPLLPPDVHITSPLAYFRWHGHGQDPWYNYRYSKEELEPWAPMLRDAASKSKAVYGYFNNHFHGYAPENCLQVLDMLGVLKPEQRTVLRRIRDFRRGVMRTVHGKVRSTTLEDFAPGPEGRVASLLDRMTTRSRFERARRIAVKKTDIDVGDGIVRARIGAYMALIDSKGKRLKHDCEDWKKNLSKGLLCKHLLALFMTLPSERSLEVLQDLEEFRDRWTLES